MIINLEKDNFNKGKDKIKMDKHNKFIDFIKENKGYTTSYKEAEKIINDYNLWDYTDIVEGVLTDTYIIRLNGYIIKFKENYVGPSNSNNLITIRKEKKNGRINKRIRLCKKSSSSNS